MRKWLAGLIVFLGGMQASAATGDTKSRGGPPGVPPLVLAELRLSVRCRGNDQCRFVDKNIPLDLEVTNPHRVPIGFPSEYVQKQGPSILLTAPPRAGAPGRELRLSTNLADWKLRDRFVTVAPGKSVELHWVINASEIAQLSPTHGAEILAHVEVYAEIEVGRVKQFARARQVIRITPDKITYFINQAAVTRDAFLQRKRDLVIPTRFTVEASAVRATQPGGHVSGSRQQYDAEIGSSGKPAVYSEVFFPDDVTYEIDDRPSGDR